MEQNLASITLPLIATLYLERANDWESVGVQRKAEAIRYIRRGEGEDLLQVNWILRQNEKSKMDELMN